MAQQPSRANPEERPSRGWLRASAVSVLCLAAGALAYVISFGIALESFGDAGIDALAPFLFVDLLLGAAACIAIGPIAKSTVGNALVVVAGVLSMFAVPAWIVAVVRFGERRSLAIDASIVTVVALGTTGMSLWQDAVLGVESVNPLLLAVVAAVLTAAVLLWGRVRGTRAALVAALREQAESTEIARAALEHNRETELALARTEERAALARDMHDGISHQLSIVAMHAGALASRDDLSPEQIRQAARTTRDSAAEAGEMLRKALTALRTSPAGELAIPLPSATSIEALVAEARDRGASVALVWRSLSPDELARCAGQAVTLARILEEILMNSAKHAPGEELELEIERSAETIVLRARNRLADHGSEPALGTGHGLIGIAERVGILGGSASYGPTARGDFEVEARIPWV